MAAPRTLTKIAQDRIDTAFETRSPVLDLTHCGLNDIPKEVFTMEWLEELIITNFSQFELEQRAKENKAEKNFLDVLGAGPNEIRYIPGDIASLQNLRRLRIGASHDANWKLFDIGPLAQLRNLTHLDLSYNSISEISVLDNFEKLEDLQIRGNHIVDIAPLGGLPNIRYIDVSQNAISTIEPMRAVGSVEILTIGSNGIAEIDALANCYELSFLDAQNNQISDIRPLAGLTKLNSLFLGSNSVRDLQPLQTLTDLKLLYLEYNNDPVRHKVSMGNIPNATLDLRPLANLTRIESLNIEGNQIHDIAALGNMKEMRRLYASENKIRDIKALSGMGKIEELRLYLNAVEDLEALRNLTSLRSLNISDNKIQSIEPISGLVDINDLYLDNNPIKDCPSEIWSTNDIRQINAHFVGMKRERKSRTAKTEDDLEKALFGDTEQEAGERGIGDSTGDTTGSMPGNRDSDTGGQPAIEDVKLIFVGNSGAGKTQLSSYLVNAELDDKRESTHGIRLDRWTLDDKASEAMRELKDRVAINAWDFGGQEFYHGTFRLFLSNHAVYVLLWEDKTNHNALVETKISDGNGEAEQENLQHYNYKYWLDSIRHYAPDSPIIILQNKIDMGGKMRVPTSVIDEYRVFADHYISLHGTAIEKDSADIWRFNLFCEDLASCLEEALASSAKVKRTEAWLRIRDKIVEAVSGTSDGENPFSGLANIDGSISLADFEQACRQLEPQLSSTEIYTLPRWLHQNGLVVYFGESPSLSDRVFLKPAAVTGDIYEILNHTVRHKGGTFKTTDMPATTSLDIDHAVDLMRQMEIVFQDEEGEYVAPQYLPETHAVEDLYAIAAGGLEQKSLSVRMPLYYFRKVLQRIIFAYGSDPSVQAKYYWKKGILFKQGNLRIMLKGFEPESTDKGILVIGTEAAQNADNKQKEVFHTLCDILEETDGRVRSAGSNRRPGSGSPQRRGEGWTRSYKQPLPRWLKGIEVSVDGENYVHFMHLADANHQKRLFVESDLGNRLKINDFQSILDSRSQRPLKVFLSYSHKDTDYMNSLFTHLAPLKRLDKIDVWTDKEIKPGDKWDESISSALADADIVLFLVSADFIASNYIWDYEIPEALRLLKENKVAKVIPIYLRPVDFRELPFADLEIVPKNPSEQLRAISQWQNIDEAYTQVADDIRTAINEVSKVVGNR